MYERVTSALESRLRRGLKSKVISMLCDTHRGLFVLPTLKSLTTLVTRSAYLTQHSSCESTLPQKDSQPFGGNISENSLSPIETRRISFEMKATSQELGKLF